MKNILLLYYILVFYMYIQDGLGGGEEILAKFHQMGYKIKDFRIQLISFDKNYFYNFHIATFKYNRTTTASNLTARLKVDVGDKLEVIVQQYKFLSNEYRHFPLRFQINLNKAFQANAGGIGNAIRCGNITKCYFYKNVTYHACNFVINETFLPPLVPNGQYRTALSVLYLNREIAEVSMFGEIYTPIAYPKK